MAEVVIGCDINDGNDAKVQNAVASACEKAGHNVEKLAIAPNPFAAYSYSSKATGKVGVYIIAAGTYSIADYYYGAAANGGSFKFAVFAIRGDISSQVAGREPGFSTRPIGADPDCPASLCANIRGLTFKQMNEKLKDKVKIVGGSSAEEIAKNVVNAIGGGSDEKGDSSASTIKEAIKEVASFWDGEVEIKVEQDTVKLRKIPDPETDHLEESIIEGTNVELNSISIQDYHPDTINILTVHWQGGEDIILKDEDLIARFGEKKKEMDAVKRVVSGGGQSAASNMANSQNLRDKSTVSNSSDENNTNKFNKFIKSQGNNNTNLTGAAGGDTDTESDTDSDTETGSTTYEEVPVTTYEEALHFANVEWAKIRRDNGHEIELKCVGNVNYKHRWVKVKLYSYPTDMWMYIKAVNHEISENGEFGTNITLVDYPPSLGEWNENDSDEESEDEEEDTDEDV